MRDSFATTRRGARTATGEAPARAAIRTEGA